MRVLISSILMTFLTIITTSAQDRKIYKYIGAVGVGDIHWITNQNTYGSSSTKGKLTFGYQYGGKFGIDINNKHKIDIGFIYTFTGQKRKEEHNGLVYKKNLRLTYYAIPITYKFVLGDVSQFFRNDFQFFATSGLRFSYLKDVNISYSIADLPVDFYTFHAINNKHLDEIAENPRVTDGSELYKSWDVQWHSSVGATYFFLDYMAIELSLEGGISVFDMNKPEWQIKNTEGVYSASRNAYLGLNLSLIYYFPYW